ncbi:MAG: hypothetical protein KAJ86_04330 [Alphaproteobacteria bacterium]|nr:hypothetical protein [Alphaproteobacteria bacterium]
MKLNGVFGKVAGIASVAVLTLGLTACATLDVSDKPIIDDKQTEASATSKPVKMPSKKELLLEHIGILRNNVENRLNIKYGLSKQEIQFALSIMEGLSEQKIQYALFVMEGLSKQEIQFALSLIEDLSVQEIQESLNDQEVLRELWSQEGLSEQEIQHALFVMEGLSKQEIQYILSIIEPLITEPREIITKLKEIVKLDTLIGRVIKLSENSLKGGVVITEIIKEQIAERKKDNEKLPIIVPENIFKPSPFRI